MKKPYKTTPQYSEDMSAQIPEGYMSLDAFGEIFHKKIEECYANIQSGLQYSTHTTIFGY
ncbi:MAG: hypothetical protein IK025_12260 [Bacteroidales bacterium]|nr:hypothetical protein [Bacteroidales bacterium]